MNGSTARDLGMLQRCFDIFALAGKSELAEKVGPVELATSRCCRKYLQLYQVTQYNPCRTVDALSASLGLHLSYDRRLVAAASALFCFREHILLTSALDLSVTCSHATRLSRSELLC